MTKLFALFFLSSVGAFAQMHTFDLGPYGRLTIYLAEDWRIEDRSMAKQGAIMFKPKKESINATCTLNISYPDKDRFETKSRLKLQVEADSLRFAHQLGEERAYATELMLTVPGAYGYYCNFTDPERRGKPSEKDNFKVISLGKIRLTPQILIDVQILADGFKELPYQQLLGAIEGMEYTPGRGR